jgi:tRNA(fMet)-specific endonuclease VapC
MRFLPDTNVWICHLNRAPSPVKERIRSCPSSEMTLCDVVKAELYYGAYRSSRSVDNLTILDTLFAGLTSLPFDGAAAKVFGEIRADLDQKGTPIGPYDLQIASIALANQCILVTHNTREFSRIHGLKLEDWEAT